ncbi:PCI domain protein [Teladorsagia circumcincta]|uniref:26S proteasome non-ATPase regulatory subunit 6 n=1 Tax=Teladorsagia circumcincta TaxID=45464 RepID=A0A2G9U048_TELCI|nr:PCI domain protein [Teladorsagia circumcincta]PIO70513.1 PCI domain protein [Teladorsagia circumcincta]
MELAQLRFLVNHPELDKDIKKQKLDQLQKAIKEHDMAPLYQMICDELGVPVDKAQLTAMKENNTKRIKEIEAEIEDAENNLGSTEVRQAWLRKFEYYCQIGDKENVIKTFTSTYDKSVGMGYRIDLVFNMIRGGDWERKNRLRSYEALYKMSVRDFAGAADLFLEAVPTFGSYELMTYENLVFYTVVTSLFALDRPDLRTKVIKCNEIQEQLTGGGANGALIPVREYLEAYYGCHYDRFFVQLAALESERFKFDRYLAPHFNYYSRGMRLRAYEQFLTPYKTVRIDMMARDFGVSRAFIDKELHRLIAAGQLHCRIDAVRGVIEMNHPDSKNYLYKAVIKDGDILLNRIQKLARVINA